MNSKNIKVVDEHNIDRNASVMFAFDLEGSEYVTYSIERDEDNSNIFVSKIIKNLDNTFNMLDIEDATEKSKLSEIVKVLISNSVSNNNDKLVGNSTTLSDGKIVMFMNVNFNKEQRFNVQKTYITTVKKEVVRVAEKYYSIEIGIEETKVEDIFPTVAPVVTPVTVAEPELKLPEVPEPVNVVEQSSVVNTQSADSFVPFGVVQPEVKVETPIVEMTSQVSSVSSNVVPESVTVVEPKAEATDSVVEPVVVTPVPVEAVPIPEPVPSVAPSVVVPMPEVTTVNNNEVNAGLVFNASKETNLNAALGEVASTTTIPVENIEPVREFGVDATPVVTPTPQPAPVLTPETTIVNGPVNPQDVSNKGGFANSKFFMVVAIAFFLASCVFLGYEVFNYFQITQ